ncbi:MFS general substrate transporter [Rhizopogon vinicolor AM-OR11-026]|uniref:MFS general substrate transporter n=1 Tax=Rhizopogon vinicolor AM-OR11-026 TaxID=1314800 RepID=A0A1B7MXE3_9AGAM|nr:MFS general substrate transporter [Rhizopogon vinicolor AM-OR11-026]
MTQANIDPYLVQFALDDKENPKNWSRARRWYLTGLSGFLTLDVSFASSAPAGIATQLRTSFKLSEMVTAMTISVFIVGYCVGPLFWGPLSEQYGRRPIFLVTVPVYACFQVGCALSKNAASLIVFRFLSGIFAAAVLTNSGALTSDIWDAKTRGKALAMFNLASFVGPTLAPLVGGYVELKMPWAWLFWILTISAVVCSLLTYLTLPETYAPIILLHKAKHLRYKTGDHRYYSPLELIQKQKLHERLAVTLTRPFKIFICEPMLVVLTIYMSFIYGCMYLLYEAYPVVFTEGYHFQPESLGLTYIPLLGGNVLGVMVYLLIFNPQYEAAIDKHKIGLLPPEIRLDPAIFGAPLFAITFFWFGWTSYPSISYWAPIMSGVLTGLSACWIFLAAFNYIIDVYLFAAASALAANTVVRSIAGAVFPLFAAKMYTALGPRWASTVLGCFSCIMIPIPFVLKRYGPALRAKSRFAPGPI